MKKKPVVDPVRDRELLGLVEHAPTDGDAILVYADWLEEQGDLPRASFLRMQQQLRALKVSHPKLLERGRALHDLAKKLPAKWVDAVSYPRLAETAWDGKDDDGFLVLRFRPKGVLNYSQPSGTYENGTWVQRGVTVAMETNAHYADYFGVIVGNNTMRGTAQNIAKRAWGWKVAWSNEPAVVVIPDHVVRTIHDDHVRAKPKPTKPKQKPVKRKALPKKAVAKRPAPPKSKKRISTRSR